MSPLLLQITVWEGTKREDRARLGGLERTGKECFTGTDPYDHT